MRLLGAGVVGEDSYLHIEGGGSHNNLLLRISLLLQFKCCGAANYTDWESVPVMSKGQVPDSCCINVTKDCGVSFNVKNIYPEVGKKLRYQG